VGTVLTCFGISTCLRSGASFSGWTRSGPMAASGVGDAGVGFEEGVGLALGLGSPASSRSGAAGALDGTNTTGPVRIVGPGLSAV
jgi:hypothetical protein